MFVLFLFFTYLSVLQKMAHLCLEKYQFFKRDFFMKKCVRTFLQPPRFCKFALKPPVICIAPKVYFFNLYHSLMFYRFFYLFIICVIYITKKYSMTVLCKFPHHLCLLNYITSPTLFKSMRYYTWRVFFIVVSPVGLIHIVSENT